MAGNDDALTFEGAVDEFRKPVLGLGDTVGSHSENIAIARLYCPGALDGLIHEARCEACIVPSV